MEGWEVNLVALPYPIPPDHVTNSVIDPNTCGCLQINTKCCWQGCVINFKRRGSINIYGNNRGGCKSKGYRVRILSSVSNHVTTIHNAQAIDPRHAIHKAIMVTAGLKVQESAGVAIYKYFIPFCKTEKTLK